MDKIETRTEKTVLNEIPSIFLQTEDVIVGPGDDCAVLEFGTDKYRLLAVDQLVSDVHYLKSSASPAEIAAKLIRRNISDIAAMGGTPSHALLAMTLSSDTWNSPEWVDRFLSAISAESERWGVSVCGGDISSTKADADVLSLTIAGWVEKECLVQRSGARPNDILYATGEFGDSFDSGHHLSFTPRLDEALFLSSGFARAMIDVSDGLLLDAARIAEASGVELRLDKSRVPVRAEATLERALSDGEDYELLFAVSPDKSAELDNVWPFGYLKLTRIGEFVESGSAASSAPNEIYLPAAAEGFNHFKV
ncbi:MAG: thiamine-phosphate kinase [Victivallales bacterium]|nr:thiamine-phosphate kinase [Victivallales bacterium]